MNNVLYTRTSGQGADIILLHGLFGQGTNLRSVARALEADFCVHCLDLPDHGRSPWLTEASLATYAAAVRDWMEHHELPAAHILGHSMGGKVAMELALTEAGRVRKLVVADMAPVTYAEQHQAILDALHLVANQGCQTRTQAEALLGEVIDDPGVVGYLLMSLERGATSEAYQWRFNLAGLASAYGRLRKAPTDSAPFRGHTLFLKGSESAYIQASHEREIQRRFPCSQLVTVNRAGHWLHIDQPEQFSGAVREFLLSDAGYMWGP
jgi:esterase